MVAPVTGPFSQTEITSAMYRVRSTYKQKKPFDRPLPYVSNVAKLTGRSNPPPYGPQPNNSATVTNAASYMDYTTVINQTKSMAYERLKGAISDRASMGENLGQLGSSARLVVDATKNILDALRRLRRFDVSAFAQWMDKGFVKRNSRFAAAKTLEWNFAIAPSIADIYSSIEILQSPVKNTVVQATAKNTWSSVYTSGFDFAIDRKTSSGECRVKYGCWVAVSNPNLWLANAMGLINPAQIAWQLLPGSFLFDWLIPVEQFLGSATDFYGLTVVNPYTTAQCTGKYYEHWKTYNWSATASTSYTKRETGISLPSLALRPLKVASMKRAANAVSLAVQAFTSAKR